MIKNVYFDNIRHCVVFETGRGDGITEQVYVNGKEYTRQDMDSIVEINVFDRNEYRLYLTSDYHKRYIVTHYENYMNGVVNVTIDIDKKKYHGRSDKSLLRYLEDDDFITFSWEKGINLEHDIAIYIGINENSQKIGFGILVEYGIEDDYKYARYGFCGFEGKTVTDFYGYKNDKNGENTDYNFSVCKAEWCGACNDRTQASIIASNFLAAKKGIRGRIARRRV